MPPFRRPPARLGVEPLEDRSLPAAHDPGTVVVGVYTGNPADPVAARTVAVPAGFTPDQAVAAWRRAPGVAYAEPNYRVAAAAVPNDTHFGLQYAQHNTGQSGGAADADLDAPEAWELTRGSMRTTVAVIDTGVDYTHPDLYLNVWLNEAEIPAGVRAALTDADGDGVLTFRDLNAPANVGPGRITDLNGNGRIDGGDVLRPLALGGWADGADGGGNGYLDDLIGWDFVGNDNDPMDLTAEGGGHGTHVAGTIGAVGNNGVGVAGVAWEVRLMAVRFLGANGGTSAAAAAAIRYSAANGAAVSNNSWGGGGASQAIASAIAFAQSRGQVFVAAAGNDAADNDVTGNFPANYGFANVVSVAATDRLDQLASFSNYGRTTVDLAAGGVGVASTYPGGRYVYMSGTSMATPQVAGVFALLLSREPSLGYAAAIARVLGTADPVAGLAGRTVTGGRVNARAALEAGLTAPAPVPTHTPTLGGRATVLAAAGNGVLAANVAGEGVKLFTPGAGWVSLGTGDATLLAVNAAGDVAAYFPGYGLYRRPAAGTWERIYSNPAVPVTAVGVDGSGRVVANFAGYGLQRFTTGWQSLGTGDATLLAVNAAGDVAAYFPGYGLFRAKAGQGFVPLYTNAAVPVTAVGVDGSGRVVANFAGYGLQRFTTGWQSLGTGDATLLAVNAAGDVAAYFPGYGLFRRPAAGGWERIVADAVTAVGIDGAGNVVANFAADGVRVAAGPLAAPSAATDLIDLGVQGF